MPKIIQQSNFIVVAISRVYTLGSFWMPFANLKGQWPGYPGPAETGPGWGEFYTLLTRSKYPTNFPCLLEMTNAVLWPLLSLGTAET